MSKHHYMVRVFSGAMQCNSESANFLVSSYSVMSSMLHVTVNGEAGKCFTHQRTVSFRPHFCLYKNVMVFVFKMGLLSHEHCNHRFSSKAYCLDQAYFPGWGQTASRRSSIEAATKVKLCPWELLCNLARLEMEKGSQEA